MQLISEQSPVQWSESGVNFVISLDSDQNRRYKYEGCKLGGLHIRAHYGKSKRIVIKDEEDGSEIADFYCGEGKKRLF